MFLRFIFNVRRNVNNEQKNNIVSGSEGNVIVFYVTGKRSILFKFQGIQNVNVDWDLFLMLTYR